MTLVRMLLIGMMAVISCAGSAVTATAEENFVDQLTAPIDQAIDTRIRTQKELDQWQAERAELVARYESLQAEQSRLTEKRDRLHQAVADQTAANQSLESRIAEAKNMAADIRPFLDAVYPRLTALVETGLPFLDVERKERLDQLQKTLANPETGLSEKFRKTMETLFIEAAYGNTSEVYQAQIRLDEVERLCSVLRVGRIALFCLSLDQETAGYYNVADAAWRPLPGRWRRDLRAAIDMAEKRRPTDLVCLPLGRLAGQ